MRGVLLAVLVLGLALCALSTSDTQDVVITIGPAYPDSIVAPDDWQVVVPRLNYVWSSGLVVRYTTDYGNRKITVGVSEITGSFASGFKLWIKGGDLTEFVEFDLDGPPYDAHTLKTNVDPGENKGIEVTLKADASLVERADVGKIFTITLVYTITSEQ